ncbi:MAG: hypothetical protein K5912_02285 [Alphaproteobacteria bacterium]|nr:hypothetical protein [Alphaproteobacteria bacterium]
MAYVSVYDGIVFIEGDYQKAQQVAKICAEPGIFLGIGTQQKSPKDVKRVLARKARSNNCNCVVNFTYGQKGKSWFYATFLSFAWEDNVSFSGRGIAAKLPQDEYEKIVNSQ